MSDKPTNLSESQKIPQPAVNNAAEAAALQSIIQEHAATAQTFNVTKSATAAPGLPGNITIAQAREALNQIAATAQPPAPPTPTPPASNAASAGE
jgi:hypothetical protein